MRACNCARASLFQSRTRVGCDSIISLRRYWQQFARVLAAEKQKARREKSRLFLLVRLSFGVWKYRHTQALDPVRFQEADVAELPQLMQFCPF